MAKQEVSTDRGLGNSFFKHSTFNTQLGFRMVNRPQIEQFSIPMYHFLTCHCGIAALIQQFWLTMVWSWLVWISAKEWWSFVKGEDNFSLRKEEKSFKTGVSFTCQFVTTNFCTNMKFCTSLLLFDGGIKYPTRRKCYCYFRVHFHSIWHQGYHWA